MLTTICVTFVKTSMNAEIEQTNAAGMHVVLTRKALTPVAAIPVSMVMECHVVITMSVHGVSTIVTRKLCALTHRDHIAALV